MFRKLLPILMLSVWCVSGNADEDEMLNQSADNKSMQTQPMADEDEMLNQSADNRSMQTQPMNDGQMQQSNDPCCCAPKPRCCKTSPCPLKECIDECGSLFFTADFLWWRAENHGFSYAYNVVDEVSNIGKVVRVNPKWDPGFRFGFGWNTTHDNWDLYANWTWYHNKSKDNRTRDDLTQALFGETQGFYVMHPLDFTGPFLDVTATWNLRLNAIDAEMGRGMWVTKCLGVRPHWGVRAAWLDQKFHDHFSTPSNAPVAAVDFDELKFSGKNNYWGIGPRAGFHAEWHMPCGFSFLGRTSASVLYGKTRTNYKTETFLDGDVDFTTERQISDNFWQLVPTLQLLLGMQWDTCFKCDTMYYAISVSWETNYWWNQNNVPVALDGYIPPVPTVGNQPVTMEGLTVNMEWDY